MNLFHVDSTACDHNMLFKHILNAIVANGTNLIYNIDKINFISDSETIISFQYDITDIKAGYKSLIQLIEFRRIH